MLKEYWNNSTKIELDITENCCHSLHLNALIIYSKHMILVQIFPINDTV